jgi:hypothetical protein
MPTDEEWTVSEQLRLFKTQFPLMDFGYSFKTKQYVAHWGGQIITESENVHWMTEYLAEKYR